MSETVNIVLRKEDCNYYERLFDGYNKFVERL